MSTLRDLRHVSDGMPRCVRRLLTSLIAALPVLMAVFVSAAAGDLDPTFDGDGKVVTDLGGDELAQTVAIQADGKIVAAGGRSSLGTSDFALARYNADGFLDGSFGFLGTVATDFGGHERAEGVVIQADGKIVAAGSSGGIGSDFLLARYNPDGSLDSTFGAGGKVLTDFGGLDTLTAIAIQPSDGKIVAAGQRSTFPAGSDFALARYNSNGALDSTFGVGGRVLTDFGAASELPYAIAIGGGKIVAVGLVHPGVGTTDFVVVRYNYANGFLDSAFGAGGKVVTDFGGFEEAFAVAIQPDGYIVAAGDSDGDFALARYKFTDGSLDSTFGVGGKVVTDFGGNERANALAIRTDGTIVAAGESDPGGSTDDFALARYNPDGSPDSTFGAGGKALTDFTVEGSPGAEFAFARANSVAIQTDGNIVAAGTAWTGEGETTDFALARYLGAGNTPVGTNVGVQVGDVGLTFQNVIQPGDTTVTKISTGPAPPEGFSLGNPPTYFDITTTAVFSGSIEVCITYTGIAFDNEAALQLLHFEGTGFVNVTTSLDTVNDVICGSITSFSLFVIGEPSFVSADVGVDPSTINKKAKGSYITVYIEFAGGAANPADIDVSTVTLSALGFTAPVPSGSPTAVGDGNGNGVVDLMVKFDRATVQSWFAGPATASVRVAGRFVNGTGFQGEDVIVVIDEGAEHTNESDPRSVRR